MQATVLTVILPVKDIEREIVGILRFASEQIKGMDSELIVVDMGSSDRTVLQAVRLMKDLELRGFVIQNGDSTAAAALNTAVQKAGGDYLTFLFARRLYHNFISPCMETARRTQADFLFGCSDREEARMAEHRALGSAVHRRAGSQYLKDMIRKSVAIDISAVLVRREFLLDHQVDFEDSCRYGYAEEFVSRCLLHADSVVQAPVVLKQDESCELKRGKQAPAGTDIFQCVEAVRRVADLARAVCVGDTELIRLLEKVKIPQTVMSSVDVLLREGGDFRFVRSCLQDYGYDRLLTIDRRMDPKLRRRILFWRVSPALYRPK